MRNKNGLWIFGSEGRHLLHDIYKLICNCIKWKIKINVDYRSEHFRCYRRSHNFLKTLLKGHKVTDIERQAGGVLMPSEFLQQVTAFANCAVQIKSVNTPGGTGKFVVGFRKDDRRAIILIHAPCGNNTDNALVPGVLEQHGRL